MTVRLNSLREAGFKNDGSGSILVKALLIAPLLFLLPLAQPAGAASLDCSKRIDEGCLAEMINRANLNADWDVIYLGKGTYQLTKTLPDVTSPIYFQGMGAGLTAIHGSCTDDKQDPKTNECSGISEFRVLHVAPTGTLVIDVLSITNAQANAGAAIYNEGSLQLYRSTIMKNHAHISGGGIYNTGSLYMQDSTVDNNVAHQGGGGGIFIAAGAVDIRYSTIHSNWTLGARGAGIANGYDNSASGGSVGGGVLSILNSTISGNVDKSGSQQPKAGGILNIGTGEVWLKSVTITGNAAFNISASAGGVYSRGKFYFSDSIIAKNGRSSRDNSSDCGGQVSTLGGNLVGTDAGCEIVPDYTWDPLYPPRAADQIGNHQVAVTIDPLFEEDQYHKPLLKDNGGNSCTVALRNGSTAINAGWTGAPGDHPMACEAYDQRWAKRNTCDIGAFEFGGAAGAVGVGCPDH